MMNHQLIVARSLNRVVYSSQLRALSTEASGAASSTYYIKDEKTGLSPFVMEQRKLKQLNPDRKKQATLYAVRKGREIGVFEGWETTKGKVLGFKGAHYKPFQSARRAREWLESDEAVLAEKDMPTPKSTEIKIKPSKYVLNFSSAISRQEGPKNGLVGVGWILRKLPENQLVLAGCDLFDTKNGRRAIQLRQDSLPC
jgi:hypothetical protein